MPSHSQNSAHVNSGALSLRSRCGTPKRANRARRFSITSPIERFTQMPASNHPVDESQITRMLPTRGCCAQSMWIRVHGSGSEGHLCVVFESGPPANCAIFDQCLDLLPHSRSKKLSLDQRQCSLNSTVRLMSNLENAPEQVLRWNNLCSDAQCAHIRSHPRSAARLFS